MKKVSMYLLMLWIFFLGISSFYSNVFSATSITTSGWDTICSSIYAPVCWVLNTELCYDNIWWTWGGCRTIQNFKTFWNECELWANQEWFRFFKNGSCEPTKSITVTSPLTVEKWATFTYSWNAVWWYEYCMPTWTITSDMASSGNWKLLMSWSVTMQAPAITSTITSLTVWVQCYYKDLRWMYVSDSKTATITLTSNQCVQLWWSGPNWSIWPNDPNKDKKCCAWLTLVTPPSCYRLDSSSWISWMMEWCWTICANIWDWICDSKYENTQNSKDCVLTKNIIIEAPFVVTKWEVFTYWWNALGWYEYCMPAWSIFQLIDSNQSSAQKLWITWSTRLIAPAKSSTLTSITVGVQCYYKNPNNEYLIDVKYKTITLKNVEPVCNDIYAPVCWKLQINCPVWAECIRAPYDTYKSFANKCSLEKNTQWYIFYKEWECEIDNKCVQLWWSGPNWSMWPQDPNIYKKCCTWLTLVTPPSCNYIDERTWLTVYKEWCGTICANVWDSVCDSKYENTQNSKDCVTSRSITLEAPTIVPKWTTFTYSWNALWWYEYCIPKMNGTDLPKSWSWTLWVKWNLSITAPSISSTSLSMTVGVQCFYRETNSNIYKSDAKHTTITLKNSEVCNSQGTPMCWVKYLQSCTNNTNYPCQSIPVYKTFLNECELIRNTAKFTFFKNWKCEDKQDDLIELTNSIKLKLDKSIKKLIDTMDQNNNNSADKIKILNGIIDKLLVVQTSKPKYRNLTQYLINKINEEILKINLEDDPNIDEIINIFN